jgi:hypothetical protein
MGEEPFCEGLRRSSGLEELSPASRIDGAGAKSYKAVVIFARERRERLALIEDHLTECLRLATRGGMRHEDFVGNGSDELVTEVGRPLRRSPMTLFERGGQ